MLYLADSALNYKMLYNFGPESTHDLDVLSKGVTRGFYNASKFYAYYSGCSDGGPRGLQPGSQIWQTV